MRPALPENDMKRTALLLTLAALMVAAALPAAAENFTQLQFLSPAGVRSLPAAAPTASSPSYSAGEIGPDAGYAPALEVVRGKFRLARIAVDIQGGEVRRQSAAFKNRVSAEKAVALALDSFLNDFEDPDSPLSLTLQALAVEGAGSQKVFLVDRARERLFSMLNRTEAALRLAAAGEKAGRGEEVSGNWIFALKLPAYPGYAHWAVVSRADGRVYNYGTPERGWEKAKK